MKTTEAHLTALAIRDELYGGSWERMAGDLTARQAGRSFLFRLPTDIDRTLAVIDELARGQ